MKIPKRKILLVAIAAFVLLLVVFLWLTPSSSPPRLTYLYTTNASPLGKMGVFRLENGLDDPIKADWGFYQKEGARGVFPRKGDYSTQLGGPHRFPAGASNTFQTWIPTNGGPYRLVLVCIPPPQANPKPRGWLLELVALVPFTESLVARLEGVRFPKSQYFQASPPDKITETNAFSASPHDNSKASKAGFQE